MHFGNEFQYVNLCWYSDKATLKQLNLLIAVCVLGTERPSGLVYLLIVVDDK